MGNRRQHFCSQGGHCRDGQASGSADLHSVCPRADPGGGSTSGVGIVMLVPLIWTVLFQRWRDSALVLAAIKIVELVISLELVAAPAAVTARRLVLCAALGALIVVATHTACGTGSLTPRRRPRGCRPTCGR